MRLETFLEAVRFSAEQAHANRAAIGRYLLETSPCITEGNFRNISTRDLLLLFDEYDRRIFSGGCREALGEIPLRFRLSSRMTRSGGTTARHVVRRTGQTAYFEITVSTTLLFQTFEDTNRAVSVAGVTCRHRLDALQCILEHEMVHLVEMLVWRKSSCKQHRFQSLAQQLFGHTDYSHGLVTPRERALKEFGIAVGSRVRFRYDGAHYEGVVNRITQRASVLVPDQTGEPYSDGRRYTCYYIPLEMLEPVAEHALSRGSRDTR